MSTGYAADGSFVVKQIKVEGLNRISQNTIQNDIPISVGDTLTAQNSSLIINDLFKTGFFDNIKLYDDQGTLVIQVNERPTIGEINITGNEEIKTADLQTVLQKACLQVGNMFNHSLLQQIQQSLQQEYYSQGKYAVKIDTEVTDLPRNRVNIAINISEGLYAKIARINIVGNHAFSEKTLLDQLTLTTPTLWAFFTKNDQYSSDKLNQSLQALQAYYMNRGYINFRVNSTQVSMDPTRRSTFITVNIAEGNQYTFSGFTLQGDTVVPEAQLQSLVKIQPGEVFSRQVVLDAVSAIKNALGDQGYAFAEVNPVPKLDDSHKTVALTFNINPGRKTYIRYINFIGNTVANDQTLRQRIQYMEDSLYSTDKLNQSMIQLQRLPYIQQTNNGITPDLKKVPGSPDQADMNYNLTEQSGNTVGASIGYSQLYSMILGANLNMTNLFGTGNIFSINSQISQPYKTINATFTQPFFTQSGISQSLGVYYTNVDAGEEGLTNYTTNSYGVTLTYGMPISAWDTLNFGGGYDHTQLLQPSNDTSATVSEFVNDNGDSYDTYTLTFGWSRNTTNKAYFPTAGIQAGSSVKVAVPGSSLTWYQLFNSLTWYKALTHTYTLALNGSVNYGNGYGGTANLPFFDNWTGGGWGSVRGYDMGSLGAKDTLVCSADQAAAGYCTQGSSMGQSIGGNLAIGASANLLFPIPFVENSNNLRLDLFADAGNDYLTYNSDTVWTQNGVTSPRWPTFQNLRYSVGIGLEWYSPLGALGFSIAQPLNEQPGDSTNIFQFTLGGTF